MTRLPPKPKVRRITQSVKAWALRSVTTGELFGGVQEVYLRRYKYEVMSFVEWQKRVMKLRQPRYVPVRVTILVPAKGRKK